MSNPNDECRKGKKEKEFKVGQEVYTIELAQGLDGFKFKKWQIAYISAFLPVPYFLMRDNIPHVSYQTPMPSPEMIQLCQDSIFSTPQEAAEELHERLAKLNRQIEIIHYPGIDNTWSEFIV